MFCKKKDIKVKGICQSLSKIVTETPERTIKKAAIAKNDYSCYRNRFNNERVSKTSEVLFRIQQIYRRIVSLPRR